MRFFSEYFRRYSSKLFPRSQWAVIAISTLFFYAGVFLSLQFFSEFGDHAAFTYVKPELTLRVIAAYFTHTLIFALGLSQAGFVLIPIVSMMIGFIASTGLYTAIKTDILPIYIDKLLYLTLFVSVVTVYAAAQMRNSWNLFSKGSGILSESLDALQENIKLYYFTLAVFVLLTLILAGLGYIFSFIYRSLL